MSDHSGTLKNGLTLGYAEHGDPQGVPMFYFHGWPSARVQGALMDEVAKRHGLHLIFPGRPGIGLSDYQPNRRLSDWPELMEQLAAHVGAEKFHLMGWSGGGPYVFAAVVAMPKRVLSSTIVCGAPPLTFLGYDHMFWVYRLMIRLRHVFPSVLGLLLRLGKIISGGSPDRPSLKRSVRRTR
jgi:pimeloyl-ACP methyl ester carboxylesterase